MSSSTRAVSRCFSLTLSLSLSLSLSRSLGGLKASRYHGHSTDLYQCHQFWFSLSTSYSHSLSLSIARASSRRQFNATKCLFSALSDATSHNRTTYTSTEFHVAASIYIAVFAPSFSTSCRLFYPSLKMLLCLCARVCMCVYTDSGIFSIAYTQKNFHLRLK